MNACMKVQSLQPWWRGLWMFLYANNCLHCSFVCWQCTSYYVTVMAFACSQTHSGAAHCYFSMLNRFLFFPIEFVTSCFASHIYHNGSVWVIHCPNLYSHGCSLPRPMCACCSWVPLSWYPKQHLLTSMLQIYLLTSAWLVMCVCSALLDHWHPSNTRICVRVCVLSDEKWGCRFCTLRSKFAVPGHSGVYGYLLLINQCNMQGRVEYRFATLHCE